MGYGWVIFQAVVAVVSIYITLTAKPKGQKTENQTQREGVDNELERVYGTRRLSMVITDAMVSASVYAITPDGSNGLVDFEGSPGLPDVWSDLYTSQGYGRSGFGGGQPYWLKYQGPLCVSGRWNAPFDKQRDPDGLAKRELANRFDVLVNGKPYYDGSLISDHENAHPGNIWWLYLQGGDVNTAISRDRVSELIGEGRYARPTDAWTGMIHAGVACHQRAKRGLTYNSIPEVSFLVTSNALYDPRYQTLEEANDPLTWYWDKITDRGRPTNPILQLLDYMLDYDYGCGLYIADFDLDSWKIAADIADLRVAYNTIEEDKRSSTQDFVTYDQDDNLVNVEQVNLLRQNRAVVRHLLESNITLSTGDSLADNLGALLAATRGASLFKNKAGKWKIAPAWLLNKDLQFTFPGNGITGYIYNLPFVYNDVQIFKTTTASLGSSPKWTPLKNGIDYALSLEDATSDTAIPFTDIPGYTGHNWSTNGGTGEATLRVNFAGGLGPTLEPLRQYTITPTNYNIDVVWSFIPNDLTIVGAGGYWWEFRGTSWIQRAQDNDGYGEATAYDFTVSDPYESITLGVRFISTLTAVDTIKIMYPNKRARGLEIAAYIMRSPTDLGLNYNSLTAADTTAFTQDSEDYQDPNDPYTSDEVPILLILNDNVEYASVSTDERLNQATVKYPDRFNRYKLNEVSWPITDSALHLEYLEFDGWKPLTKLESINSITDRATALDHAEFLVRQSRSMDSLKMKLSPLGNILEPNDIVMVNDPAMGIGNPATTSDLSYYWKVNNVKTNPDLTVDVTLVRYEAEDYTYLSSYLSEKKYQSSIAPLPFVTFPDFPVTPYLLKSAGFGDLTWNKPSSYTGQLTYLVTVSREAFYSSGLTYPVGAIVLIQRLGVYSHFKCLVENIGNDPTSSPTFWVDLSAIGDDDDYWLTIADTASLTCVIPNMPDSRTYVFCVRCQVPYRGMGPGAYFAYDIRAFDPYFSAKLHLKVLKATVIIPKEGVIPILNIANTGNTVWLLADEEYLPLHGNVAPNSRTDLNPGTWFIESLLVDPGITLKDPASAYLKEGDTDFDGFPVDVDVVRLYPFEAITIEQPSYFMEIVAVFKTEVGTIFEERLTVPYLVFKEGADGIDGGTVAQLSIYTQTAETYDEFGELIEPTISGNSVYDWTLNKLTTTPIGWTAQLQNIPAIGAWFQANALVVRENNEITTTLLASDWNSVYNINIFTASNILVKLYRRSTSVLTGLDVPPPNFLAYDFLTSRLLFNADLTPLTELYEWSELVPYGSGDIWEISCRFTAAGTTGMDRTSVWTDPNTYGLSGLSLFGGILFTRSNEVSPVLTEPVDNAIGYNFDLEQYERNTSPGVALVSFTQGLTTWYVDIPDASTGKDLYAIRETFSSNSPFGTDEESEWSTPVLYVPAGEDGFSFYTCTAYLILPFGTTADGTILTPPQSAWNFDDPSLSVAPRTSSGTWTFIRPSLLEADQILWSMDGYCSSPDPQGIDITITWQAPIQNSKNGWDAPTQGVAKVFKRVSPSTPPTLVPSNDAFYLDFSSFQTIRGATGNAQGWTEDVPSSNPELPVWTTTATVSAIVVNGVGIRNIQNVDWGTPYMESATADASVVAILQTSTVLVPVSPLGAPLWATLQNSSQVITVWEGGNKLKFKNSNGAPTTGAVNYSGLLNGEYYVARAATGTITLPAFTNMGGFSANHGLCSGMDPSTLVPTITVNYQIQYKTSKGVTNKLDLVMVLTKVAAGAAGFLFLAGSGAPSLTEVPFPSNGQVVVREYYNSTLAKDIQESYIYGTGGWVGPAPFIGSQIINFAAINTLQVAGNAITVPVGDDFGTNPLNTGKTLIGVIGVDWKARYSTDAGAGTVDLWPTAVMAAFFANYGPLAGVTFGDKYQIDISISFRGSNTALPDWTLGPPTSGFYGKVTCTAAWNSQIGYTCLSSMVFLSRPTHRYMTYYVWGQAWGGTPWHRCESAGLVLLGAKR